jgi:hypothetical protein
LWMRRHVLRPLSVTWEDAYVSDCLDKSRLNPGQANRVSRTYDLVRGQVGGLEPCTLRPVPGGESAIVEEARAGHLGRLTEELQDCEPSTVVTLGNAALRVMTDLLDDNRDPDLGAELKRAKYGQPVTARLDGRPLTWIPLVHPRPGKQRPWKPVHETWESWWTGQPQRGTCPKCASGEVLHIGYGMTLPDPRNGVPGWVEFAGCVVRPESKDRRCDKCGYEWNTDLKPRN